MTSLEIVNQALDSMKKFKSKIYKLTDSDIRKIKKDLEVSEILKDLFNEDSRQYIGNDYGVKINGVNLYMRNRKDFEKVKKWLKSNKVGDSQ